MSWRKKVLFLGMVLGLLVILLFFLSIVISNYYGRMRDDEALNTFQISMPTMPKGTIPLGGGIEVLRKSDPQRLINPWPLTQAVIDRGRRNYITYCWPCHGPGLDGKATVGQSFYPLPTDLLVLKYKSKVTESFFTRSVWALKGNRPCRPPWPWMTAGPSSTICGPWLEKKADRRIPE